jgi:LemA protein
MLTGLMFIGIIILLGFLVLVFVIGGYNALVTLRNRYKNAYSQIDVQLKRRYDLIPNLVETAKGYLQHERGTLEAVILARNAAVTANTRAAQNPGDASAMKEISSAESALSSVIGRLFALAEAYPNLKANTTMMSLMEELILQLKTKFLSRARPTMTLSCPTTHVAKCSQPTSSRAHSILRRLNFS